METFDPKDPLEIIPLTFDFAAELQGQSLSGTPTVVVTVYSGTDPTPANIISGAVTVLGDRVRQNVKEGVLGVEYLIKITVTTTTGLKYTKGRILPLKDAGTY